MYNPLRIPSSLPPRSGLIDVYNANNVSLRREAQTVMRDKRCISVIPSSTRNESIHQMNPLSIIHHPQDLRHHHSDVIRIILCVSLLYYILSSSVFPSPQPYLSIVQFCWGFSFYFKPLHGLLLKVTEKHSFTDKLYPVESSHLGIQLEGRISED